MTVDTTDLVAMQGRSHAIQSCKTGVDRYNPPYPFCQSYDDGWHDGCAWWDEYGASVITHQREIDAELSLEMGP